MTIFICVVCFALGVLFGVSWMCALSLAKQADNELEEKEKNDGN
jgi:MFS superfamily sulfate permease-like transporter